MLWTPHKPIFQKKFPHKIGPWKCRASGHFGPNGALLGPPGAQERPDTRSKCVVTMCPTQAGQSGAVGTKYGPPGPSEDLRGPELATVKPLELTGYPGLLPSQREALVKSVLQKVQLGAVEEASLLVCKSTHLSTVGEVMESFVVCLMETDTKTRTTGGQLLDTLLIRGAIEPDLVKECVLEKLVETAVDMIEVVSNFWDSLAEIFSPSFNSAAFPLSAIKDSADLLPSDKMVCSFIFYTHFEIFTRLETFYRPS